ncbi:MAG: thiamine pyrophosphate-binding protein [Anaerolineae bacterium]
MSGQQGHREFEGTGAEILVECLVRAGVGHVFGVPGDTGVTFYDALYHHRDTIHHVLARDERHAAFMADAYARAGNTVGVVEASSGGGVTFLVGGLGEPWASSVPLLVLTTDIHRRSRNTGALTEIDQTKLFSAVTKWQAAVETVADIPRLVCDALCAATTGRPAPVSLVIPEDVMDERARVGLPTMSAQVPGDRPSADTDAVARAANALTAAHRPAIVAGSGVHLAAARDEISRLANTWGIPVATSIHGKGALAEDDPWSLGVAGANGARDYANDYLAAADAVLFVGTRANATDTNSFKSPPRTAATMHIDIEAERAGRNYPGSVTLVGDARTVLCQIMEALGGPDEGRSAEIRRWIAERRQAWAAASAAPADVGEGMLHPRDVVRAIRRLAGADALILGEPGTPTPNIASYWETARAERSVIIPRGHGPMGYVIPGAIGAAFAHPERTIVGLTGDGSFGMACGELETAARFHLPIVYVQFSNGSLGWIKMLQHLYSGGRYFGVDFGAIDSVKVAEGMGLAAHRATSLDDFAAAFETALARRGPTYIDVPVPDEIHLTPPVAPWQETLTKKAGRQAY